MADSEPSLQEIRRQRQEAGFVGRAAQLALFRQNLLIPVADDRRRFVFSIHGVGGIGKTSLVERLKQQALEMGRLCAVVDEHVYDVPEAMRSAAAQLEHDGARLRRFSRRYEAYAKRHQDRDNRRGPADGAGAAVTGMAVRAVLGAARGTAIGGAITGSLDPAATTDAVEQVREAAKQRIARRDALGRQSSAGELTEAFLADLRELGRPVTLFFDAYELTSAFLDDWLRDVISRDSPADIIIVVAGRHPLDRSTWSSDQDLVAYLALQPFTETETRQLLAHRGITDERAVDNIQRDTRGLPLMVKIIDPEAPGDVTRSVVERALRWEDDPARCETALLAALPRRVNLDVLEVVVSRDGVPGGGPEFLRWLGRRLDLSNHAGGYEFHDVIRTQMIRLYRGRAPQQWRERHAGLADAFGQWRDGRRSPDDDDHWLNHWRNTDWRDMEIERLYHRLCADPSGALGEALRCGICACNAGANVARKWTEMVRSAGNDAASAGVAGLGGRLQATLDAAGEGDLARFVDQLAGHPAFPPAGRGEAFRERGRQERLADRYEEALADFGRAIKLDRENWLAFSGRGETHRLMGSYEEAIADLTRAVELRPQSAWNFGDRGIAYLSAGQYGEALADLTHAIEHGPRDAWYLAQRADAYQSLGQCEEALADLTEAIEIEPTEGWPRTRRGNIYRLLGRYPEGLDDLARAVRIDPLDKFGFATRAQVNESLGRPEEAMADYSRAIEIDRSYDWAVAARGRLHRKLGRLDAARTDFIQAALIDPGDPRRVIELGMMGLPHAGMPLNLQSLVDVEVTAAAAAGKSSVLLDWLRAEGILAAERVSRLPNGYAGYPPGPSQQATAAPAHPAVPPAAAAGAEAVIGRCASYGPGNDQMSCPSCAAVIPLQDGDGPTPAWDILNDVMLRWEEGGPNSLPCPRCGADAGLARWRFQSPWAFGNLTLNFWDWPPLGEEFVSRVSDLLGHRVVVITTNS